MILLKVISILKYTLQKVVFDLKTPCSINFVKCSIFVGPRQVPIWQDKDLLSRRSGCVLREASLTETASLWCPHSAASTWMARQEALHEDPSHGSLATETWPGSARQEVCMFVRRCVCLSGGVYVCLEVCMFVRRCVCL